MKNFISLVLFFCLVIGIFSIIPVSTKALTYGLYQYEELTDGTVKVTKYTGSNVNVIMPNSINGKKISIIGEKAFENNIKFVPLDPYESLMGNVDLNGVVNIFDVTFVQKHSSKIIELDSYQLINADVNNDGEVNIFDATKIQRMIAGYVK